MMPQGHAVISAAAGAAVWGVTHQPWAVLSAVLTGVLVDLDHLLDYYRWIVKERREHVWLVLHGYELTAVAVLAAYLSGWDPVIVAAGIAWLCHVLTDQFTNHVRPGTYFLTYRALQGFRRERVSGWIERDMFVDLMRFPGVAPIVLRINPRMRRYLEKRR